MKNFTSLVLSLIILVLGFVLLFQLNSKKNSDQVLSAQIQPNYWFVLHRKSNVEYLFKGVPGDRERSEIVKVFKVKTGIPGERPTPLPKLVGRDYWIITRKYDSKESEETAPYFLTLNIPGIDKEPFGPVPYNECSGQQCNWILPGEFGLHGINGDETRLSVNNPGSAGCIRHKDEDITYLYNILDPDKQEIRYYIEDI